MSPSGRRRVPRQLADMQWNLRLHGAAGGVPQGALQHRRTVLQGSVAAGTAPRIRLHRRRRGLGRCYCSWQAQRGREF